MKRAALFIHMNDLVCTAHNVIPIVNRPKASAISTTVSGRNALCTSGRLIVILAMPAASSRPVS